jgi:D-serine deaminase-like pyridoxal phosphate-dependent protein
MANAAELANAAVGHGRAAQVVIEVDIGMKRAGVAPGAAVVALAKTIAERPGLWFRGLIGWEAHAVTIADPSEKERTVAAAIGLLTASATACRQAGCAVRDRELRRHRLVPLLCHAAGRDRRAGRGRDLQRHALPRPLPHRSSRARSR